MPTYDYECARCGKSLQVEQSMRDKPLRRCSACGGRLVKLLPQSLNLIFKGSGFYITDYKKSGRSSNEARQKEKVASGVKQADKD